MLGVGRKDDNNSIGSGNTTQTIYTLCMNLMIIINEENSFLFILFLEGSLSYNRLTFITHSGPFHLVLSSLALHTTTFPNPSHPNQPLTMAGGATHSTTTTNPPDHIDELFQQMQTTTQKQASFATSMAEMSHRIDAFERRSPELSSTSTIPLQPPRLKLDVPRFDGSNPHAWIFKISQFFFYHHTPETDLVTMASFYLDGAALSWYQWMYRNGQIHS